MKKLLTLAAAFACCASLAYAADDAPKREFRSAWMAGMAIDWPKSHVESTAKQQLRDYLDNFQQQNFTGVCIHVRPRADAYYKSSYEPWSGDLTGTRGKDPGWDPLAFAVEECHKRGLECYAWINPFRVNANSQTYTTDFDNEWREKGWLMKGVNGTWTIFNPGIKEAREHCLDVFEEIYTNYDIDGMLFDDYFYPGEGMPGYNGNGNPKNSDDYQTYLDSGSKLSLDDWRRENVNTFVEAVYERIQATRPDMRFGIGPAGVAYVSAPSRGLPKPNVSSSDWQYAQIFADPLAWLSDGTIDFISPQIYWARSNSYAPYAPLAEWWSMVADHYGRHNYVSIASYKVETDEFSGGVPANGWAEIGEQVNLCREYTLNNSAGQIYYNTQSINGPAYDGLGDFLGENNYSGKALIPVVDWKDRVVYSAPADAAYSDGRLTWTATERANRAIIRYTVYAVPNNVIYDRALNPDGDGISSKYLLGVTYSPSFDLPSKVHSGYYYAVCVYDGYGYESEPALVDYDVELSQATTIIAPKDGANVEWQAEFSWNEIKDATYDIEISADPDFRKIDMSFTGITAPKIDLDLISLASNSVYYWRVISYEPSKAGAMSDVGSFTTGEKGIGDYERGYTIQTDPANYDDGDYSLASLWMRSITPDFANFSQESDGLFNRGMVATSDYVYLSNRSEGSQSADISLQAYNALTGEHEFDIPLSENGKVPFYPCNDVIKDSEGNICIANLSLDISTTPIVIHLVDLATGELKEVASLPSSKSGRVDHIGIYGDARSGNFTVFAAIASGTSVFRWLVTSGKPAAPRVMNATVYSPAGATGFGIAPKVFPVSKSQVYVDGGSTSPTLYDFSHSTILDAIPDGASHAVKSVTANGLATFTLGTTDFMVYPSSSFEDGYKFSIVSGTAGQLLSEGKLQWTAPQAPLGSKNSSTFSAPADAVVVSDTEARVYFYVPGNGLCAYTVKKSDTQGIEDVAVGTLDKPVVCGDMVTFSRPQTFIKAYSLTGALVASVKDSAELRLPAAGNYVVVTPGGARKIVIR